MELYRSLFGISRASKALRSSPRTLSQRLVLRQRHLHHSATASPLRSSFRSPSPAVPSQPRNRPSQRFSSTTTDSRPLSEGSTSPEADSDKQPKRRDVPAYELTFTCKPCLTRATHRISKQGYHNGTVLITCPNCKARHLISDHLKVSTRLQSPIAEEGIPTHTRLQIFKDSATTIEDILKEKGDLLKKGTLGDQGDIEFWDDGSVTHRSTDTTDEMKSARAELA